MDEIDRRGLGWFSRFEWDEEKRQSNLAKHGIDFVDAIAIFADVTLLAASPRSGEDRFLALGVLEGRVIAVIVTRRGQACRIISTRRARKNEQRAYYQSSGRRP